MAENEIPEYLSVFRYQTWFRPHVAIEGLDPFPVEKAMPIPLGQPGNWVLRLFLGKGPVSVELPQECSVFFEHGEEEYPVFTTPSIGPKGAGLFLKTGANQLKVDSDSALFLVDVLLFETAQANWLPHYGTEQPTVDEKGVTDPGPLWKAVDARLSLVKQYAEIIIGAYALYQYPLVWQRLACARYVTCVTAEPQSCRLQAPLDFDNYVPFTLKVGARCANGALSDGVRAKANMLFKTDLHMPFLILQQTLWQKDVNLRFLQEFWIIELLAQKRWRDPEPDLELERLIHDVDALVCASFPGKADYLQKRIGRLVDKPSLQVKIRAYLTTLGVQFDDSLIARARHLRNQLAHGVNVSTDEVRDVETFFRLLPWSAMHKELEHAGIFLEEKPYEPPKEP
jgi:hypothetical protein